jgi:hypothetical protein
VLGYAKFRETQVFEVCETSRSIAKPLLEIASVILRVRVAAEEGVLEIAYRSPFFLHEWPEAAVRLSCYSYIRLRAPKLCWTVGGVEALVGKAGIGICGHLRNQE